MHVLYLTVFLSLLLAALFLLFFVRESQRPTVTSPEQKALRPLDTETPTSEKI
ncbi:MAG: hypothetical protein AAGC73_07765 [Verrucomicrobiota bacterium]